jgi:hypothetical protein
LARVGCSKSYLLSCERSAAISSASWRDLSVEIASPRSQCHGLSATRAADSQTFLISA